MRRVSAFIVLFEKIKYKLRPEEWKKALRKAF